MIEMRAYERVEWTHQDDLELVEAVLRNVRKGKTAIDGIREFAEASNGVRSVDASKFRFHTKLKAQYAQAYAMAQDEGKKHKPNKKRLTQGERYLDAMANLLNVPEHAPPTREVELDDIMLLLKRYMKQSDTPKESKELAKLREENEKLKASNIKLVKAFNEIEHDYIAIKNALGVLRNAGVMIDVPAPTSTVKYRVDKNGLVEAIE